MKKLDHIYIDPINLLHKKDGDVLPVEFTDEDLSILKGVNKVEAELDVKISGASPIYELSIYLDGKFIFSDGKTEEFTDDCDCIINEEDPSASDINCDKNRLYDLKPVALALLYDAYNSMMENSESIITDDYILVSEEEYQKRKNDLFSEYDKLHEDK